MIQRLTRSQELLLKAALLAHEPARRAWSEWREDGDLRRLDPGSARLIPLLYQNLRRSGVPDPPDLLRKAYRRSWVQNRLLFSTLGALLRDFEEAAIDTLILKGAALAIVAYGDRAVRPMVDLDVLVPVGRARDAIDVLERNGWRSTDGSSRRFVGVRHADEFIRRGFRCDLHWHALQECLATHADDDFWSAAREISVEGARTRVLCPADQLLHVCVHGARSTVVQPVAWIADAVTILEQAADDMDWARLVDQATKRQLTVAMREALRYLQAEFGAHVPPTVIDRLAATPTSRAERLEYQIKIRPRRVVGSLPVLWFDHSRSATGGRVARTVGFARFLQVTFRTETLSRLPLDMARLAVKRLAAFFSPARGLETERGAAARAATRRSRWLAAGRFRRPAAGPQRPPAGSAGESTSGG